MLNDILLVVAAVIAVLLIYAAFKPDSLRLSRSGTVAAPPAQAFALINDLRRFNEWNPFAKMDPQNAITYDTVTAGVGGAYKWQGAKSGAGRMQITESVPPQRVTARLDFSKPFEGPIRGGRWAAHRASRSFVTRRGLDQRHVQTFQQGHPLPLV